ncbi:MAG: aminoglycoside phosphotransferase family protein [Candidatus Gottesmanbacteria bacterium]
MPQVLEHDIGLIASEQVFSDPSLCRQCGHPSINPLTDGLINENFITCAEAKDCTPNILVVFPNPAERIQREQFVRELLPDRSVVPMARIYKTGLLNSASDDEQGFMVREYIPGTTLNEALSRGPEDENIQQVLYQLGRALSAFHEVRLPTFGKITGDKIVDSQGGTWSEYVLNQVFTRIKRIREYSSDAVVGDYSAGNIQHLLPDLADIVVKDSHFLRELAGPRLVHHDFHFLNIIVNGEKKLHLAAILDTDGLTAGDPVIDLVSIESQLHIAADEYRDLFLRNGRFFHQGYLEHSLRPPYYDELRRLYHIDWSLSYFCAVFGMDKKNHPVTSHIKTCMDRHYEVISRLSAGESLDAIGIQPVIGIDSHNGLIQQSRNTSD